MENIRYIPVDFNGCMLEFGFNVEKLSIHPYAASAMVEVLLGSGYKPSEIKDAITLIDTDFIAVAVGISMQEAMDEARGLSKKAIFSAMKKA